MQYAPIVSYFLKVYYEAKITIYSLPLTIILFANLLQIWMNYFVYDAFSGQTEQQTKVLPGGHRLMSEYFQSCDSKQISSPGSVLLQETSPAPVQWAGRGQI